MGSAAASEDDLRGAVVTVSSTPLPLLVKVSNTAGTPFLNGEAMRIESEMLRLIFSSVAFLDRSMGTDSACSSLGSLLRMLFDERAWRLAMPRCFLARACQ